MWNEEIIDFFEIHTTIDQIRKHLDSAETYQSNKVGRRLEKFSRLVTPLINLIINLDILGWGMKSPFDYRDQFKEIHSHLNRCKDISSVFKLLRKSGVLESRISQLEDEYHKYLKNVSKIKDYLDILLTERRFPSVEDKMTFFCTLELDVYDEEDEKHSLLLNTVPVLLKDYYITLGPWKCRSLGFKASAMEKEYRRLQARRTKK